MTCMSTTTTTILTTATTTTTILTTATTTTRIIYYRATGTPRDADATADAKRGAAATAGAIVGTLLLLLAIVAAVWHKRHAHAQSINRQFAARVTEQAVAFFVANFAHLLVDASEPNNLASGRAAHLLKTASLCAGLPSCKLIKGDTMGRGWYGTRYFATLRPTTTPTTRTTLTRTTTTPPPSATISPKEVVAKVCGANYGDQNQGGADLQQKLQRFCVEALLIGSLEHPCILPIVRVEMSLLPFMVITERMQNGSLKDYLRACRPSAKNRRHKLAVEDLLGIGLSVVQACEFLEARKVVHRALMAENVLVGSNHTQIKLSGFSSLRDVLHTDEYIKRSDTKDTGLDIRFMAIESFAYNRFSVKSDVWAFGILMWEILTLARKPYGAFNPSEIAAEVRSGRRLERVDVCPLVLFEEMAKCWHEVPSTRPTFSELQGTLRLLLLEDADALRANVAAATKVSADALSLLQWDVPVKGWDVVASKISDCGMFKLHSRRQGAHARLALASNNPDEAAVLKTVFCVLQNLTHEHLVPLLGCRSNGSAGTFSIFFDLPCSTSANAITLDTILHTPLLERQRRGQQQSGFQRKEQPEQPSPLDVGYLTVDSGTLSDDTETDDVLLHTTTQGCLDLALQMTLAIEYVHANQIVHGRLSSRSFYSCDVGSSLRLLVGNALGATNFFSATSPVSHAAAAEAAADAAGASGATAAIKATLPQNLRWLPYDIISGSGQGLATLATDVYSLGVLLWELFAARGDGGLPHSAAFPSDVDLWHAACTQESLPPLHMNLLMAPESILAIYAACTEPDSRSRPWVSGVATMLLDEFPCRWEKDRTQLEFVMNLGAGEFGQVVKMSTRMFSKGGEKDFVAVKMLSSGNGGAGAGAGSGGGYSGYSVGVGAGVGNAGYSGYSAAGLSVGGGSSRIADVVESESADAGAREAANTLQAEFLHDSLFLNFLTGTISGRRMDVPPEPLHRPLVAEMTQVLAKHGVQSGPPPVIRALIQDCLIREPPTARPTFGEIVTRTRIGTKYVKSSPTVNTCRDRRCKLAPIGSVAQMCWIDSSYSATTITPFENGVVTLAELNFTGNVTIIGDTDGSSILLSGVMSEWNDDIDGLFVKEAMLLCSPSLPGCGAWIRGCYGHPIAEATSGWESPRVASVALPEGARFDRVVLQEEISKGQRVWTGGPWLLMHNGTSIGNKKIVINAPALSPAAAPPLSAAAAAAAAPPLGPASARGFVANPKHFCESAMQHVLFRGNVSLDVCKAKCEAAVECWCYDYAAQPPHRQSSCRVGSDQNAAIEPSGVGYTAYSCTDCKPAPPPPPPRPPRVYVAGAGGKVRLTVHEERDVPIIRRVAVFAPCSAD
eukprot:gene1009-17005_t